MLRIESLYSPTRNLNALLFAKVIGLILKVRLSLTFTE
jgi:hypothetical protein